MASKLLRVLDDIETERQRAIRTANGAGFNLHPNASFSELADCFVETSPNYLSDDIDPSTFRLPTYLYDPKQILKSAPTITKSDITFYPFIILTFKDDVEYAYLNAFMMGYTAQSNDTYGRLVYTSDGVCYSNQARWADEGTELLGTNSNVTITHTWGNVNKKYIIIYGTETYKATSPAISSWNYKLSFCPGDSTPLNNNEITQIYMSGCQGDLRLRTAGTAMDYAFANTVINIEIDEDCIDIAPNICYCPKLLRFVTKTGTYYSYGGSPVNLLQGLPNLTYIDIPKVNTIRGYNATYVANAFQGAHPIYFNAPNIEHIEGTLFGSGSYYTNYYLGDSPIKLIFPKCTYWVPARGCYSTQYLKIGVCNFDMGLNPNSLKPGSSSSQPVDFGLLRQFEYGPGSQLHFLRFNNLIEYIFKEPCTLQGIAGTSLNYIDMEKVTLVGNDTTGDVYLGYAPRCHTIIWPIAITASLDITGFPNLTEECLHELVECLEPTEDCYIKLTSAMYSKLSQEDIEEAAHEGWELIVNG